MKEEFKLGFIIAALCLVGLSGYWAYDILSKFLRFYGIV